ncbi:MAG: MFS transporter [Chitinophagaceae bacterium]|nr:MAG: MFS transporter [Chitinophagaceae bacterium]
MTPDHSPAGVRALFLAAGALFATWGVHVPSVKAHFGVGEQALGMAMLGCGLGAVVGLTQAGRLIGRHGPRPVLLFAGTLGPMAIALLLAGHAYPLVLVLMFTFGLVSSTFDVAMNVAATDLEQQAKRPMMSGFHGMFSAGGMIGAGVGAMALHVGVVAQHHLWMASLVCALLGCWGATQVGPGRQAGDAGHASFMLAKGPLGLMGALAALGLLCEGAMYDWSVLYVREGLKADPGSAAWAYASFSGAMAAGRFGGDALRARLKAASLMRWSALLAALGMGVALMFSSVWLALLGFALVGLGLANVVPLLFVAAGHVPGVTPAHGIAFVSALGYLGMMGGPALIGWVAQTHGLTLALAQVVGFALILAAASQRALASHQMAP